MTFWAAIVSLSLAIALFALAMLFSIKYSNDQVFAWLMNFVKAILIDLLVCPIAGLIIAFVLLKYTPPGKFNFLENFLGYNLCLLLRTLKWVPPRTKKEVTIELPIANTNCIHLGGRKRSENDTE